MAELAPSIISADYTRLADSLGAVAPFSTSWHVDVMDGHYVPNLTIGPMIVDAIAGCSDLPQDVHLMIANPDATWEWYAKAGARRVAFHAETSPDAGTLLRAIAEAGAGPGLALNPDSPVSDLLPYLDAVDHVVVMSVYPGFSGQSFIPGAVPKIAELRQLIDARGRGVEIYVDGGVSSKTAQGCVDAGVDILISASAIFGSGDPASTARELLAIGRSPQAGDRPPVLS